MAQNVPKMAENVPKMAENGVLLAGAPVFGHKKRPGDEISAPEPKKTPGNASFFDDDFDF
jgi:hypothetical protein